MARVTFASSQGVELVGTLQEVAPENLVILTHGFSSDRRSRGRFEYISRCLNERGFSTLAFDFGGCGESGDARVCLAREADDLRAAVAYARTLGYSRFALWGNSLGSRVALEVNPEGTWAMVLTGAGTGPVQYHLPDHFSPVQLADAQAQGWFGVPLADGPRAEMIVDAQFLADLTAGDQESLLSAVRCPVLIIHGDGDAEERLLLQTSRRGLRFLPPGSAIEVLPGARHGFFGYIDRIVALGGVWLDAHLPTEAK
jgi:pimeloyl-ACP methyl ester carboxylesterase